MRYTSPGNIYKPYVDWRKPENRMEGFLRWLDWRMTFGDLDHYACNNSYRDTIKSPTGKPMTREQSIWFSIIFGMTYQSEMAWVIYWNFPDFESIDFDQMQEWNLKNLSRQKYAKDTKYNKGRIVEQVKSIKEVVSEYGGLEAWADSFVVPGDEHASFEKAYEGVLKFHKFGRMTTWICLQVLFETAGLPIRPNTLMAHDQSSWSVRSGLYFLYNKDEKIEANGALFDPEAVPWILSVEKELYKSCYDYVSEKNKPILSNYLIESHLCQYKKLMLGGDYPGHSSGDHVSRASWLAEAWPEVNFESFFNDAIKIHHPLVRGKVERKDFRNLCANTGQMINMHQDFSDMPDLYEEFGISKSPDSSSLEEFFR